MNKIARIKNMINKSKAVGKKPSPYDLFLKSLPSELDYFKDENNYRLKAAWKSYGEPKNLQEAYFNGLVDIIGDKAIMPSIGYNEETDEYEYLNKGKDNDIVNKDIRVWENETIPFVKELKNGGYIRTFNEELNCWMYLRGGKTQEKIDTSKTSEKDIDDFNLFLATLPPNQRNFDPKMYNMRRYWELKGKPKTFWEALNSGMFVQDPLDHFYHANSVALTPEGNYEFIKSPNHKTVWMEEAWYNGKKPVLISGFEPDGLREHYTLVDLDNEDLQESNLFRDNYELVKPSDGSNWKYIKRASTQTFKLGGKSEYKKVKSDKAYYDKDSDTVYYTNDEDLIHEGFHARPDSILLEQLKPYYENLNDEKILNFGGNLLFVKRFEGDPGHFYSPEELGARVSAAKFRTKGNNYTPEFFKYLRTNENLYGDNMRDLLYMYNDENLSKIFNLGNTQAFKQGGQMNVIPEGALHAHKNHMDLAKEGTVTSKGIPVVTSDEKELTAEVEREEWTMTKELTDDVEAWYKKYYDEETSLKDKDDLAIKCGKRIVKELLHNTDDRANLIAKMLEEEE